MFTAIGVLAVTAFVVILRGWVLTQLWAWFVHEKESFVEFGGFGTLGGSGHANRGFGRWSGKLRTRR